MTMSGWFCWLIWYWLGNEEVIDKACKGKENRSSKQGEGRSYQGRHGPKSRQWKSSHTIFEIKQTKTNQANHLRTHLPDNYWRALSYWWSMRGQICLNHLGSKTDQTFIGLSVLIKLWKGKILWKTIDQTIFRLWIATDAETSTSNIIVNLQGFLFHRICRPWVSFQCILSRCFLGEWLSISGSWEKVERIKMHRPRTGSRVGGGRSVTMSSTTKLGNRSLAGLHLRWHRNMR